MMRATRRAGHGHFRLINARCLGPFRFFDIKRSFVAVRKNFKKNSALLEISVKYRHNVSNFVLIRTFTPFLSIQNRSVL